MKVNVAVHGGLERSFGPVLTGDYRERSRPPFRGRPPAGDIVPLSGRVASIGLRCAMLQPYNTSIVVLSDKSPGGKRFFIPYLHGGPRSNIPYTYQGWTLYSRDVKLM